MFVLLRDFAGVLSRTIGSGETPEMKTYTLKILSLRAKIPFPILKHFYLAKNFVVYDWVGTR